MGKGEAKKDAMADLDFIDELKKLIENMPHRKGAKKFSLLLLTQSYYKTNEDLEEITSIPVEDIIKSIYFPDKKDIPPQELEKKKKNFSSLKSSLNKTLREMAEEGTNPLDIALSKTNAFDISQTKELERANKAVTKNLTSQLKDTLSEKGIDITAALSKKLGEIVRKEFAIHKKKIVTIKEKKEVTLANKRLKKSMKDLSVETHTIKRELAEVKETLSVKESALQTSLEKEKSDEQAMKEMEDKITSTIQTDIEKDIKILSEKDKELENKDKVLSEKENKIIELQKELSKQEITYRNDLSKEKEILGKRFLKEKKSLEKNIEQLASEQESLTKERDQLVDEKMNLQEEYDQGLERLHKEKELDEIAERESMAEMTEQMDTIMKDEKEFLKEQDYMRRGFVVKEENIQKMAAEQIEASMELDEMRANIEKEKETFRDELKNKFDEEKKRLRKDMEIELEGIKNEQKDIHANKVKLHGEQKALREKEKVIPEVVEKMVNQRLAKREAELDKKEKKLAKLHRNLEEEEKVLLKEKEKIVSSIKAGMGGKTSLLKLRELVKEQEKMLSMKQAVRETEEKMRARLMEEVKDKAKTILDEVNVQKKIIRDDERNLEKTKEELLGKEKKLNDKKNMAMEDMAKRYGKLIANKENEYDEKEVELNEKMGHVRSREESLLQEQKEQLDKEKEFASKMADREEEAYKMMEENLTQKEKLSTAGKKMMEKSARLEQSYSKNLKQLKTNYQQKNQMIAKKNAIISDKAKKLKGEEERIKEKAAKYNEEDLLKSMSTHEDMENREARLMKDLSNLNLKREELQEMRKDFDGERHELLKNYEDKLGDINEVIDKKVLAHLDKLMQKMGGQGGTGAGIGRAFLKKRGEGKTGGGGTEKTGSGPTENAGGGGAEKEREFIPVKGIEALAADMAREAQGEEGLEGEVDVGNLEFSEKMPEDEERMEIASAPRFAKSQDKEFGQIIAFPAGEFSMGCNETEGSAPRHKVKIERPFSMSKYPVTMLQYLQFVRETGYLTNIERKRVSGVIVTGGDHAKRDESNRVVFFILKNSAVVDDEEANWRKPFGEKNIFEHKYNHPVTQLTWTDCLAYCKWLSKSTGLNYRLPTEKEWEYAASNRGALSSGEYYWESKESLEGNCNNKDSLIGDTSSVDNFPKNKTAEGVCDMLGNVWEWTADHYGDYPESSDKEKGNAFRVVRGGSYSLDKKKINFSLRRPHVEMYASSCIGFRVVCEEKG